MKSKKKVLGLAFSVVLIVTIVLIAIINKEPLISEAGTNLVTDTSIDPPSPTPYLVADYFYDYDFSFNIPLNWGPNIECEIYGASDEIGDPWMILTPSDHIINGKLDIVSFSYYEFTSIYRDFSYVVFTDGKNSTVVSDNFILHNNESILYNIDGYVGEFSEFIPVTGSQNHLIYCKSNSKTLTAHYTINNTAGDYRAEDEEVELTKNDYFDGYFKGFITCPVLPIESIDIYFTDELGNVIKPADSDFFTVDYENMQVYTFTKKGMYEGNPSVVPESGITVFYKTDWTNANIHYKVNDNAWTSVPGVAMNQSGYSGYMYSELDASDADTITCCFNNNSSWDNNSTNNYTLKSSSAYTIINGKIYNARPDELGDDSITIYYYTGWTNPNIHYKIGDGSWTNVPGVSMQQSELSGYYTITIPMEYEDTLTACFNNGSGYWDNNNSYDYKFSGCGTYTVKNSKITEGMPTSNKVHIYYNNKNNWDNVNIHYQLGNNSWTSVPGVAMNLTKDENIYDISLDLGDSDSINFCFNDGNNNWDNNYTNNYCISSGGEYIVNNSTIIPITCD